MVKISLNIFIIWILAISACTHFDPFQSLTDQQMAMFAEKVKSQHDLNEQCGSLSSSEIQAIIKKVKNLPLEDLKRNEIAFLMTNHGAIAIAFYTDKAPEHSKAFKRLVHAGFYDCTYFHRILNGFMIQGGDINTRDNNPNNDGVGGPGYTLKSEFNEMPHDLGVLSMARSSDPNSAGSQFFICLSRQGTRHLDGKYTAFGKVVGGLDVVKKIGNSETANSRMGGEKSVPVRPVFIQKAVMMLR